MNWETAEKLDRVIGVLYLLMIVGISFVGGMGFMYMLHNWIGIPAEWVAGILATGLTITFLSCWLRTQPERTGYECE